MKTLNNIEQNRTYVPPVIERIALDNEISLALESPGFSAPDEVNNSHSTFNNDPYKMG